MPCHAIPVLRIHDILVWIRIYGSMPLTFKTPRQRKINLKKVLLLIAFEGTFTSFSKIKSQKKVTNQYESRLFSLFLVDDRRIRISE
jgi:hypothetical protein